MLRIPYETESFPPGPVANGAAELNVIWDDVLCIPQAVGRQAD